MRLQEHPDEQQLEPGSEEFSLGQAEHFAVLAAPQHECPPATFDTDAQQEVEPSATGTWLIRGQKWRISPVEQRHATWGVPLQSVSGTIARINSCRRTAISDRLFHQKHEHHRGDITALSAKPLELNHEFLERCDRESFRSDSFRSSTGVSATLPKSSGDSTSGQSESAGLLR